MSASTATPGATEDGRDPYQAALDRLNTEQGFGPAAVAAQPAPDEDAPPDALTGTAARETMAAPPEGQTDATTAPLPETSPELERLRKQYDANLRQQREYFEQQVAAAEQRAKAAAEAEADQRAREAAQRLVQERATQRAEVDRRLQLISDPNDRQQLLDYRAQLDQADAAHFQGELTRERTRAETAEQAAQRVYYQAQTERVAAQLPNILPGYAPHIVAALARQGQEADEAEVRAILARPEYVRQAQQATYQGKQAMDLFGEVLTTAVASEVRQSRQYAQQQAQARRGDRDASGLGRAAQAGNGAAEPPEDIGQYKSAPGKAGDFDKMLAALNKQQGIAVTPGTRR